MCSSQPRKQQPKTRRNCWTSLVLSWTVSKTSKTSKTRSLKVENKPMIRLRNPVERDQKQELRLLRLLKTLLLRAQCAHTWSLSKHFARPWCREGMSRPPIQYFNGPELQSQRPGGLLSAWIVKICQDLWQGMSESKVFAILLVAPYRKVADIQRCSFVSLHVCFCSSRCIWVPHLSFTCRFFCKSQEVVFVELFVHNLQACWEALRTSWRNAFCGPTGHWRVNILFDDFWSVCSYYAKDCKGCKWLANRSWIPHTPFGL